MIRAGFLTGFVLVLFLALSARFFQLMILDHDVMRARSTGQLSRVESLRAFRGTIHDRRGRPLALTRALPSVFVDPALVAPEDREALARRLAADLEVEVEKVRAHLARDCRFRWIRRRIREAHLAERLPALVQHPAIGVREELARCYPHGSVGAHLVGFTGHDGPGFAGAELAFDSVLREKVGSRVVLRDGSPQARRITTHPGESLTPREDGEDVWLAMDLTIQTFADEALGRACEEWTPEAATALVLDPRNGDVLALAGRPNYDPRDFGSFPKENFRIRAVTDSYPIGSTMKPLVVAAALDQGVVGYDETFDCESGFYRVGGRRGLHDSHPYGILSVPEVVIKSSNIGTAKIASRLGEDRLIALLRKLAFKDPLGSGLPGEAVGTYAKREDWRKHYTLPSISMGQEIAATPLQFATAFATLASGGVYRRPRVALRAGSREFEADALRGVYSPAVVNDLVVPMLERVVTEGTGGRGMVDGYRVAGKTGTAQIIERTGPTGDYASSFVAFAPAENPRFLVYVNLYRPSREKTRPYGGTCAAPAVREILERCLRYAEIPPTEEVTRRIHAPASPAIPTPATGGRPDRHELDLLQLRMRSR